MNRIFRRIFIGILSGALAATTLIATLHHSAWGLVLGVCVGIAYSACLRPTHRAHADILWSADHSAYPFGGLSA